jgi:histidinol-phosphate aminotransferase
MSVFRPNIEKLAGYTPGEQPQERGWIKLNTNENPYPPSPAVIEAITRAAQGPLNLYPDPLATAFRQAVADRWGIDPEWILPANGSDENLTLIFRSFIDPGERTAYPYPSYILYETLSELQAGAVDRIPLAADWQWDTLAAAEIVSRAKLVILPNPNSPSGTLWSSEQVLSLKPPRGVLVIDEAYGDFARLPDRGSLIRSPDAERCIITRTLSKSYSLAGIRAGYCVAHPDLIRGMRKVKDSYNCDALSLAAATAAILDDDWMRSNVEKIRTTRARLTSELRRLGFSVAESQANFVWTLHPAHSPETLFAGLRQRRILVRLMRFPDSAAVDGGTLTGLRITIGTDAEIDSLLGVLRELVPI